MDKNGWYFISGGFFEFAGTFSPSHGYIDMSTEKGMLHDKYGDSRLSEFNFERSHSHSEIWTEKLSFKKEYKNLDNEKVILYDLFTNDPNSENQEWSGQWTRIRDNEKGMLVFKISKIDENFFDYHRAKENFKMLTGRT